MKKLWAGRFKEITEKTVDTFTSSVPFDKRLWKYDIEGSVAHVRMLKKQKIIPTKDAHIILRALKEVKQDIQKGKFLFRDDLEDIHMNIEYALLKKVGKTGGRLQTARSRNDQIALDLRLFLRDEIKAIQILMRRFQKVLVAFAEKSLDIIMPGYTHLQRAQPVLLAHHALAYVEMIKRDIERFTSCLQRVNISPLGSGALAGTTLPIDRKYAARLLHFPSISKNSIDSVADRDFVVEFISSSSLLMVHLSRFSEELVLWCSEEFNFIELPDAYSTGSSIMPQKKNPDVLELTRGKAGRVFGNLMTILVVLKGLPLAYNRDLQEGKEPLFDTVDTVKGCLTVLSEMIPKIRLNKVIMMQAALKGFLTAADLAEYLVRKKLPFREAHEITGKIVQYCLLKKKNFADLSVKEFKTFTKVIDRDVYQYLEVAESINRKSSYGGTAKREVMKKIKELKKGK
jgi:argininosuccinate lyase